MILIVKTCIITGSSGSGKSSLLSLLMGLLEPCKDQILIDNMNPINILKNHLNVAYGTNPFLFNNTIRSNLQYGLNKSKTEENLRNFKSL